MEVQISKCSCQNFGFVNAANLRMCLALMHLKVHFTFGNATVRQRDKRRRPKRKSAIEHKSDSELEGSLLFRKQFFSDNG